MIKMRNVVLGTQGDEKLLLSKMSPLISQYRVSALVL